MSIPVKKIIESRQHGQNPAFVTSLEGIVLRLLTERFRDEAATRRDIGSVLKGEDSRNEIILNVAQILSPEIREVVMASTGALDAAITNLVRRGTVLMGLFDREAYFWVSAESSAR